MSTFDQTMWPYVNHLPEALAMVAMDIAGQVTEMRQQDGASFLRWTWAEGANGLSLEEQRKVEDALNRWLRAAVPLAAPYGGLSIEQPSSHATHTSHNPSRGVPLTVSNRTPQPYFGHLPQPLGRTAVKIAKQITSHIADGRLTEANSIADVRQQVDVDSLGWGWNTSESDLTQAEKNQIEDALDGWLRGTPPAAPAGDNRALEQLLGHAHQIGLGHGTTAGEQFEIRDGQHARFVLTLLGAPHVFVDFRPELSPVAAELEAADLSESSDYAALFGHLNIEADHPHAVQLRLAYGQGFREAMNRVVRHRAGLIAAPPSPSAPHGYHKIRVILLQTSNPYLKNRMPMAGELEVFETDIHNFVMPNRAVFREALPDRRLGAPVEVHDIVYIYQGRTIRYADMHLTPDYQSALRDARMYAWGRDDEHGNYHDNLRVEAFAALFATTWQTLHPGKLTGTARLDTQLTLKGAYENWLRDGTLFDPERCGRCGGRLDEQDLPASNPELRRCHGCVLAGK